MGPDMKPNILSPRPPLDKWILRVSPFGVPHSGGLPTVRSPAFRRSSIASAFRRYSKRTSTPSPRSLRLRPNPLFGVPPLGGLLNGSHRFSGGGDHFFSRRHKGTKQALVGRTCPHGTRCFLFLGWGEKLASRSFVPSRLGEKTSGSQSRRQSVFHPVWPEF